MEANPEMNKIENENQENCIEEFSTLIDSGVMLDSDQVMPFIDSVYCHARNRRNEIMERTSVYKKNLPMSMINPRYQVAVTANREVTRFRSELMRVSSIVFLAIDYALSKSDISSFQFLLLQKRNFDQYCDAFEDYLHAYFGNEGCDLDEKGHVVFELREKIANENLQYIKK